MNFETEIRTRLNEVSQEAIRSTEVFAAMNDAAINIASRSFCIEKSEILYTTAGSPLVKVKGCKVSSVQGLIEKDPRSVADGWFQWGDYIVISPTPETSYPIEVYYADYPLYALQEGGVIFTDTDDWDAVSDVIFADSDVSFINNDGVVFSPEGLGVKFADTDDVVFVSIEDIQTFEFEMFKNCIVSFACYVLSLKFKKWRQAVLYYNQYVNDLSEGKQEYIKRKAEQRMIHSLPGGQQWVH